MPTALGWRLNPKASLLRVLSRPGSGAACFTFLVAARSAVPYRHLLNCWLLAGVATMIVSQAAFSCMPFMNVAFHSPPLDAAAWLRVIGVALAVLVIVGFERRVRTQAEKSQTPDAHARALPQLR